VRLNPKRSPGIGWDDLFALICRSYLNVLSIGNLSNLLGKTGVNQYHLRSRERAHRNLDRCLFDAEWRVGVQELSRLHPVAQADVQRPLDVTALSAETVLKTIGEMLDLSGLGRQPENDAVANEELIPNRILPKGMSEASTSS
jgi:hypothetical protein